MRRNCSLEDISDGKLYDTDDLVEVSCNGCKGKATCCHGMGQSIILDPYDVYRLTSQLKLRFEELLTDKIELNVVDGIILPNLKMSGPEESCAFLNDEGKCTIHAGRPGICRIFPLGRYYHDHNFHYFLQINECNNTSATKRKVGKWIDTTNPEKNKEFLIAWHYFLNEAEAVMKNTQDPGLIRNLNMYLLQVFYQRQYDGNEDFYPQFHQRLTDAQKLLRQL